jgi:hypothetical protein
MRRGRIGKIAGALALGTGLTAGALLATTGAAFADYGPGATYQIEVSANGQNLLGLGQSTGGGFWFWAALTPSSPGATSGTADYQETDCVHNFPGAPNGSTHNSGNATWIVNGNGTLTIEGVNSGLGPVNITVSSIHGHYVYPSAALPPLFGPSILSALSAQVQVAP